jgi:hypothetical protein
MFDFEYLLERACLFEDAAYYIEYGDWVFEPKALKLIKKNPIFNDIFAKYRRSLGIKKFNLGETKYGGLSFEFPQSHRGIGRKDKETNTHYIEWVGTHQQYNKIISQR